jgi:hypothetical protein
MAIPPPGASSQWVGRDRCRRICLDSLNRMRKKLFIDGIHFILFFNNPSSIVSNMITFFIPPALSAGRTSFRVPLPLRLRVGLGVCGLTRTTPTRAALPGSPWQFPRVDDRRVQKTLTWPWWSWVAPSLDSLSFAFPDGPCLYQILSRKRVFLTCSKFEFKVS